MHVPFVSVDIRDHTLTGSLKWVTHRMTLPSRVVLASQRTLHRLILGGLV